MDFTDKEIEIIFNNVIVTEDGYKLFKYLLEELGAFERGINFQDKEKDYYNRVKREQGLKIFDILVKANLKKLMQIINERNEENGKQ